MRPTTLFSNHDEITYAAHVPEVNDARIVEPGSGDRGERTLGSSAFSMFNDVPDALRASRGFHLSARVMIALAVAATFGGYALAREQKARNTTPVVVQEPAPIEEPIAPLPAAIDPTTETTAPAPTAPSVEPSVAQPTRVPAARKAVKPASPIAAPTPSVVPTPTPVIIATPPVAQPAAPVVETPTIPEPTPEAPAVPAPVVEPPTAGPAPVELPPAPVPAPVEPVAPTPAPASPDAPAPAPGV